jgi:transcriptional regulator GlxA family with amidase domain
MNLLRLTNDPIHAIASAVGSPTRFHFSTAIQAAGRPRAPRAYRREIANRAL